MPSRQCARITQELRIEQLRLPVSVVNIFAQKIKICRRGKQIHMKPSKAPASRDRRARSSGPMSRRNPPTWRHKQPPGNDVGSYLRGWICGRSRARDNPLLIHYILCTIEIRPTLQLDVLFSFLFFFFLIRSSLLCTWVFLSTNKLLAYARTREALYKGLSRPCEVRDFLPRHHTFPPPTRGWFFHGGRRCFFPTHHPSVLER
ncbi:hypothetical protein F5X96DRAFT_337042 [Biscogniauxia mediterranea]|nr:hypothetical protein F5X96DRAFT_337042 [Biscogniauxia mediterranea]